MEELNKALQELHDDLVEMDELLKAAHYWKNKDPKKYRKMLNKLKSERKKPGSKERGYQEILQARRRERGGSGTTSGQNGKSGHSSGHDKSKTSSAVKRFQSAEKKAGQKLSPDRKDNNKGYGGGNVRNVPQHLNNGDENRQDKKDWINKKKKKK